MPKDINKHGAFKHFKADPNQHTTISIQVNSRLQGQLIKTNRQENLTLTIIKQIYRN
jgi:hypothetical protein